jgi:hypothetical protein
MTTAGRHAVHALIRRGHVAGGWIRLEEAGGLVEVAVGVAFVERSDELAPDEVGLADAEAAVMLVVDVGFLDGLHGQSGDFVEAKLNGGVEPHIGGDLAGDPGPEAIAGDFVDLDGDVFFAFGCRIAEAGRAFDRKAAMLANLSRHALVGQRGQYLLVFRQVVNQVEQGLLAIAQFGEDVCFLVEEIVDQVGCQYRIVGREEATMRNLDIGELGFDEVMVQVAVLWLAGVGPTHRFGGVFEVQRRTDAGAPFTKS